MQIKLPLRGTSLYGFREFLEKVQHYEPTDIRSIILLLNSSSDCYCLTRTRAFKISFYRLFDLKGNRIPFSDLLKK